MRSARKHQNRLREMKSPAFITFTLLLVTLLIHPPSLDLSGVQRRGSGKTSLGYGLIDKNHLIQMVLGIRDQV